MKRIVVLTLACSAAACVPTIALAPSGTYQPDAQFAVTLPSDWTSFPEALNGITTGEFLTKDGVVLNRVHFTTIAEGSTLVRDRNASSVPRYRSDASQLDLVEFVTSSIALVGYSAIETDNIRPETLDGVEGLRFDLSAALDNGLKVKGDVVLVENNDALNVILYIAPEEHYFAASKAEVDQIIASVDLP